MGDFRLIDTCVEQSYGTLNELLEVIKEIDKNKIMSFAFEDGWTEVKVRKFILRVGTYHSKLKEEKYSLEEFSKEFNKKWATDNNECFTTVEKIFSKIQETLKDSMRVFLTFSNRMKLRVLRRQTQLPAYKGSVLGAMYRQKFIPFVETDIVSPIVADLCKTTLDFFVDVRKVLSLCRKVILQEARIRKNPSKLASIFNECYNQVLRSSSATIEYFKKMEGFQLTNPKVKEMNETKDIKRFLANCFHTQTESEWTDFVIQDKVYKARTEKLHPLEEKLWNKVWDKIIDARLAIKYFDEMEPKGNFNNKENKYKLKGAQIAMLMKWCGITDRDKNKGIFMKYFSETYKGTYLLVKDGAVYEAYNSWKEKEYKKFEEKLNRLVEEKKKTEAKVA